MTNLEITEKIKRDKLEAKILLEVLEVLKPILKKYKGKKVLKVDGSLVKALQGELLELYYTIEKKYNREDLKVHRFYLVSYGFVNKGFELNFFLKHKVIKHGKAVEYYTEVDQHRFGTITEEGILIDLKLEALEKHLNKLKSYNIRSVISKFKRVNEHITKIEEIEKGLPYYLTHNVKLWQPYYN